jgi:hypothetical protein
MLTDCVTTRDFLNWDVQRRKRRLNYGVGPKVYQTRASRVRTVQKHKTELDIFAIDKFCGS